jgi:hypothetical protein
MPRLFLPSLDARMIPFAGRIASLPPSCFPFARSLTRVRPPCIPDAFARRKRRRARSSGWTARSPKL